MKDRAALIAIFLSFIFAASCRTDEKRAPDTRQTEDQQQTVPSRFEGKWQVSSASYQTTGPIYYIFQGDTLTIESRLAEEKRLDSPQRVAITQWKFAIDNTKTPARLIMTRIEASGTPIVKETEAFEFRNRELWLCRDFGRPITSDSFRPGSGEWVTGLTRID